jgi:hypothetical protein
MVAAGALRIAATVAEIFEFSLIALPPKLVVISPREPPRAQRFSDLLYHTSGGRLNRAVIRFLRSRCRASAVLPGPMHRYNNQPSTARGWLKA